MSIGYVISKYPAISHTFIQREIVALRGLGVDVHTFSVRQPPSEEMLTDTDRAERNRTCHLLPTSFWKLLQCHAIELFRSPIAYFRTLWLAILHRGKNLTDVIHGVCYFAEAIILVRESRKREITRLHSHFINSGGEVSLIASRHMNIPWSCTLHGLSDYGNPKSNFLTKKIELADTVFCVTDFGRAQAMLASTPDAWHKLCVVRCGLDAEMLVQPQERSLSGGPLKLVTVGRLSPEKGQTGLLNALRIAIDRGVEVTLRIIGDGPLTRTLERSITELELTKHVQMLGAQPPHVVRSELAQADVCVMSSLMEGLPVTLMESMAQSRPVIAPCVAGIPELVRPGNNGWLFTASRWDELAGCIMDAASRRSELSTMGRRGRNLIRTRYQISFSALQIATILGLKQDAPDNKTLYEASVSSNDQDGPADEVFRELARTADQNMPRSYNGPASGINAEQSAIHEVIS